jgi:hypothetical protein
VDGGEGEREGGRKIKGEREDEVGLDEIALKHNVTA